ncbi:uncharacterized protein METZ01_LOCUS466357 [marine metagenome]|uniref:DUF4389 domain-containing protein n=1 Tax=marine metagenome TaxID=408172 RepID=A0A383B103_9ZZZZ
MGFGAHVKSYLMLLRDEYPSVDEDQAVRDHLEYPDAAADLNRWVAVGQVLLALPHYVVLFALSIASLVCIVIAWFAILFTGRYPRGLFDFVVLVMRYWLRVVAYAFLLTTDHYPPFAIE